LCCTTVRPQRSTLFPYTTLFRSANEYQHALPRFVLAPGLVPVETVQAQHALEHQAALVAGHIEYALVAQQRVAVTLQQVLHEGRSEEHTSELQSRENLVCRLLLE